MSLNIAFWMLTGQKRLSRSNEDMSFTNKDENYPNVEADIDENML